MPLFLIFNLIFSGLLMNISLFKSQKKGFTYLQALTWRAGPGGELTWRGYDEALRPHARAAGGLRKAQVAHRARTSGRRPRGPCGST